jgi:hypothetical protein
MAARLATVLGVATAAVLACAGGAAGSSHPANVQWESYLPALPSSTKVQPRGVPYCRRPSRACVDTEVRRLRRAQRTFRCDHRAVFATTYLVLTREFKATIRRERHFFQYPRYLFAEDALFADVYFNTLSAWRRGKPVPPAWRIAFETARSGQVNAGQDMLLGINAHVQNDMPFVVAALGVRTRRGASRKPDHDKVNLILDAAYERVVEAVARRYDPLVSTTNASWDPFDDVGGLEMVKAWREGVWRNAERLLNARSADERRQVAVQIQQNAAGWATFMAAPQTPGYRATRDAYCASHVK